MRAVTYCIVPRELAPKLHEPLRRHFAGDPSVEVVVERRGGDRRSGADRRAANRAPAIDQRRIRSLAGRRAAQRRAPVAAAAPPALPRKLRGLAARLSFVERLEPSGQELEDADTARLVARIQAGERDMFAILYLRYFDRVYNYLRVLLNDPVEAEDAAQQVFVKLLDALPRYERRRQPFRAWLFTVVRNHALDELAKLRRVDVIDPVEIARRRDANGDVEDLGALDWISDDDLLLFVERLPLVQRQVLLMRYMLDLSHREIGAILGRSAEDVAALQSRAQRFLRERLTALGRVPTQRSRKLMRRAGKQAMVLRKRRYSLLG
jgi:RNA polymerase sigma-70 factor (ECF subfamily)